MRRADPGDKGFDAARLARIDAHLKRRYLEPGLLPNAQVLVARDGEVVHFSTMGAARADGTPLAEDAIFRIASMTKPVTSIAYMMLVEEGLTALDDPVARVIPEFADLRVYAGGGGGVPFAARRCEPMRMIDLLRHTAGFTYGFQNRTNIDAAYRAAKLDGFRGRYDQDAFIAALAGFPLEFAPGEAWNYSVATDVLGIVVSRLSGVPLGEFFRTRIFEPLGMADTSFHCPPDKRPRLGDGWAFDAEKTKIVNDPADETVWAEPPLLESGGGGLLSTSADYHRFATMLLNGGALDGARIVSPKTLALMTANHLPGGRDLTELSRSLFSEAMYAGIGFGLGFAVVIDPPKTLIPASRGEFSWGGLYSTFFFVDPVERVTMVFMTQLMPSSSYPVRRELKTLVYGALADSRA